MPRDTSDDARTGHSNIGRRTVIRLLGAGAAVGGTAGAASAVMGNVDTGKINLTAICTDKHDDLAKFRVTNDNGTSVEVTWEVYGTDHEGSLMVGGGSKKYITVPTADDRSATVKLYYDGTEVNVKASNTQKTCDLGEPNGREAYQLDLACGEVIEGLGDSKDDYYGRQGRLVQAVSMLDDGTLTRSYNHPHADTKTVTKSGCELTYSRFDYDEKSGRVRATVSLAADCDGKTLTLAGYELPEGTTEFQRKRADEQELVDHETVTLDGGKSTTLVIDLDD